MLSLLSLDHIFIHVVSCSIV